MSDLRQALEDYISIRRSLGFDLQRPAGALRNFVSFLQTEGASYITAELALRWAKQSANAQPATWACRLGIVRRFATWHRAADPRTEVPSGELLPHRYQRKPPYIYNDAEIERIVCATEQLPSSRGLRAITYSTCFQLLAVTGMRVSEALALDDKDVDLEQGLLTIRRTKFGKSRLLPVHASTTDALRSYIEHRDGILPKSATQGFFVSERGTRITGSSARYTFAKVSQKIGLRAGAPGHVSAFKMNDGIVFTIFRGERDGGARFPFPFPRDCIGSPGNGKRACANARRVGSLQEL